MAQLSTDSATRRPAARDPGLPGRPGPAALLRRRGLALQPPHPAPLRDPRRDPHHAGRRGGGGRRRRARPADGQGRGRRRSGLHFNSDDHRPPNRWPADPRHPGHPRGHPPPARAGGGGDGRGPRPRGPARPRRHREHRRPGHGRQRPGRRHPGGRRRPLPAGARPWPCAATTCPPSWATGSLVFAVSFSGDTEETVEAVTEAALAGAKVVAITTGGELARLAEAWEVPLVRIPPGIPQPRTGLGALAIPALAVLEDIGLFPGATAWVHAAVEQLKIRRDQLLKPGNVAETLARGHRPHHPRHPRRGAGGRGRRLPLEVEHERERQGPRLLEHPARAVPQRGLGMGPARRRHPPGHDPGRPAPRLRAPPGHAPLRAHLPAPRRGRGRHRGGRRPRARASWPSSST